MKPANQRFIPQPPGQPYPSLGVFPGWTMAFCSSWCPGPWSRACDGAWRTQRTQPRWRRRAMPRRCWREVAGTLGRPPRGPCPGVNFSGFTGCVGDPGLKRRTPKTSWFWEKSSFKIHFSDLGFFSLCISKRKVIFRKLNIPFCP